MRPFGSPGAVRLAAVFAVALSSQLSALSPADRFTQLDRNGDGKLSADEVAEMPSLVRLMPTADTDRDGALSKAEIRAAAGRWPALATLIGETPKPDGKRAGIPRNERPIDPKWGPDIEPKEAKLKFRFVPDYLPGTNDPNGEVLGGTELLRLTAHDGRLFAAVGYFAQDPAQRRAPGAQVVRKDSADGKWTVDATFPGYVRVDTLLSATFSVDANGRKLVQPVTMLVAGLWWNKVKPWGMDEDEPTSVAVRDDATGKWTISTMAKAGGGVTGRCARAGNAHRRQDGPPIPSRRCGRWSCLSRQLRCQGSRPSEMGS